MGKYYVFLFCIFFASCTTRHGSSSAKRNEDSHELAKKYEKALTDANKATLNYRAQVEKKKKGEALARAKDRMDRAWAKVEKYKYKSIPKTNYH